MTVAWVSYEPHDPGVAARLQDLPRVEARRAFNRCMDTKPDRIAMLGRLLADNVFN